MTKLLPLVLKEGITHIEDLPIAEFIQTIESLGEKIITEKLDGGNLWFGLDETGVYTSREGKSPKKGRFYKVTDIATVANYNAFRSAHKAIEAIAPEIKKHFKVGDSAEIEILYGRQPNTVTYGIQDKSFIVILRGVSGTPDERVSALASAINNKKVMVKSDVVSSDDGDKIKVSPELMVWEFTKVKPLDSKKIDTKEALVRLAAMKEFIEQPNSVVQGQTNKEVAELSLTSISKEKREAAKEERDRVKQYILDEFKKPIKDILLSKFVRKIKPFLQAHDLDPSEDIGVEGVVISDPITGNMTKIVDKEMFTAINTFNSSTRNSVSGLVRTSDQDAALEMRGGIFGQAKIEIAHLLGAKELALSSSAKRFMTKFKQDTAAATLSAVTDSLSIDNTKAIKNKILSILDTAEQQINATLKKFKSESSTSKLTLKAGKEIKLTPEVIKRTLTAFAETKKELKSLHRAVSTSNTNEDLIWAMYGKIIENIHDGESPVKEQLSLIKSFLEDEGGGEGASVEATTASSIAAYPQKIKMGIVKRARGEWKAKKFKNPLLKSIQEAVEDEVAKFSGKAVDTSMAKKDIEFSQLRSAVTMGDNVTTMDVTNYLNKAHELNNEVDTKVFGMEMSDGKIAKVYINATEADKFEEALAAMLGQEKDLEEVLNELAERFDIVDVVWPKDDETIAGENDDEQEIDSENTESDSESEYDLDNPPEVDQELADHPDGEESEDVEEESGEEEKEYDLDNPPEVDQELAPHPDGEDAEEDSEDTESEEDTDDTEEDAEEDSDEDSEDDEDTEEDEDQNDEEDSEEDEDLDDEHTTPKSKKKPTPKEESMSTLGQKFTKSLLEAKKPVEATEEHPSPMDLLLKKFTRKEEKAIVKLMMALGLPAEIVEKRFMVVREAIQDSADMFIQEPSFRTALNRYLKVALTESVKSVQKQLHQKTQVIVMDILTKLGLVDAIIASDTRGFQNSVRDTCLAIAKNASLHTPLILLARSLGVDTSGHPVDEEVPYAKEVKESADDNMVEVENLLMALGLDLAIPKSINTQLTRGKARQLINILPSGVKSKMALLIAELNKHMKNAQNPIDVQAKVV